MPTTTTKAPTAKTQKPRYEVLAAVRGTLYGAAVQNSTAVFTGQFECKHLGSRGPRHLSVAGMTDYCDSDFQVLEGSTLREPGLPTAMKPALGPQCFLVPHEDGICWVYGGTNMSDPFHHGLGAGYDPIFHPTSVRSLIAVDGYIYTAARHSSGLFHIVRSEQNESWRTVTSEPFDLSDGWQLAAVRYAGRSSLYLRSGSIIFELQREDWGHTLWTMQRVDSNRFYIPPRSPLAEYRGALWYEDGDNFEPALSNFLAVANSTAHNIKLGGTGIVTDIAADGASLLVAISASAARTGREASVQYSRVLRIQALDVDDSEPLLGMNAIKVLDSVRIKARHISSLAVLANGNVIACCVDHGTTESDRSSRGRSRVLKVTI